MYVCMYVCTVFVFIIISIPLVNFVTVVFFSLRKTSCLTAIITTTQLF